MDIMLVDDNPLMQQLVARFLGDLGYSVGIAGRADEAVVLARRDAPALFMIDIHLPDLDGPEALLALRNVPGCATTPAIALSGLSESDAVRFVTPDFVAYLPKPIELDVLEATVARHFNPDLARSVG